LGLVLYLSHVRSSQVLGIRGLTARRNDLPIHRFLHLRRLDKAESHFVSQPDSGRNPFQDLAMVGVDWTDAYALNVKLAVLRRFRVLAPAVDGRGQSLCIFDAAGCLELTVKSDFERQHEDA